MVNEIDDYVQNCINVGRSGSQLLRALTAPTLKNSEYVEVLGSGMGGVAVLRVPHDYKCVVTCNGGDPSITDMRQYANSMVDRAVEEAFRHNLKPVGLADIVDASVGDEETIRTIGDALRERCDRHNIAVMNGELAILGKRVNCSANMTGVLVSIAPTDQQVGRVIMAGGDSLLTFVPDGPVYMNADGIGTKTELYERKGTHEKGIADFLAMNMDDTIKIAAICRAVAGLMEHNGVDYQKVMDHARKIMMEMGVPLLLAEENVGGRIISYKAGVPAYNISGAAVSVINEEMLRNPPTPKAGDALAAVKSMYSNPRSNGISKCREAPFLVYGEEWHTTPEGREMLEYLATPSHIFYPFFRKAIESGVATSVYHMSGGAFDEKLASPLAKNGLFVGMDFKDLFKADPMQYAIIGMLGVKPEDYFKIWHMGCEAFVTTGDMVSLREQCREFNLECREVGRLEQAQDGKIGVEIRGLPKRESPVYYSGIHE